MPFLQAWNRVSAMLGTDLTPDDMVPMPENKRRCLEERIIDVAMNEGDAKIKWQVLPQEAHAGMGHGEIWADIGPEWSEECEQVYAGVQEWTDRMWSRVADEDVPPQVRGTGKRHHQHIIEFHKGGATQVNLVTNTRRTVRRMRSRWASLKGR